MISVRDAAQVAVKDPENYDARATLTVGPEAFPYNGLTGVRKGI